jgi:hypothetical protein
MFHLYLDILSRTAIIYSVESIFSHKLPYIQQYKDIAWQVSLIQALVLQI